MPRFQYSKDKLNYENHPSITYINRKIGLMKQSIYISLFLLIACTSLLADVKVARIFNSNMVLQRNVTLPVWGFAKAGETVTVSMAGQKVTTVATPKGEWKLKLKPLALSHSGQTMTIKVQMDF